MNTSARQGEPVDRDPAERIQHLLRLHRPDAAEKAARTELRRSPHDEQCRALLVVALIELGAVGEALDLATDGCQLQPNSASMHAVRATALRADHRPGPAVQAVEEALRLDPVNVNHLVLHAHCLLDLARWLVGPERERTGALQAAARSADRARQLAPNWSAAHFVRADVHLESKEWSGVETCARDGLRLDPESAAGHQLVGIARVHVKDRKAGGDHFVSAGRADPRIANTAELLEWARPALWKWAIVGALLAIPVMSYLDRSFEPWMWASLVVGAFGGTWLRWAPTNRLSDNAETARRRGRRLD